jgi:hypothetical protein
MGAQPLRAWGPGAKRLRGPDEIAKQLKWLLADAKLDDTVLRILSAPWPESRVVGVPGSDVTSLADEGGTTVNTDIDLNWHASSRH